jgi:hypothetical protein
VAERRSPAVTALETEVAARRPAPGAVAARLGDGGLRALRGHAIAVACEVAMCGQDPGGLGQGSGSARAAGMPRTIAAQAGSSILRRAGIELPLGVGQEGRKRFERFAAFA